MFEMFRKLDYKIGKCKSCKAKNVPLIFGICQECRKHTFQQANREARKHNRFIG